MSAVIWEKSSTRGGGFTVRLWLAQSNRNCIACPIAVDGSRPRTGVRAAALKQKHNLGYADAFAAELAIERGAWLITADSEFPETREGMVGVSLTTP